MYILIHRISDAPEAAEYRYGLTEEAVGTLRFDKASGEISLLEAAPGDDSLRAYQRAARKLQKHWSESQELPEKTCWAS